jgi:hypothetical protein
LVRRSQYSLAGTLLKIGSFRQASELEIQRYIVENRFLQASK